MFKSGTIAEIDLAGRELIIDGYSYLVRPEAEVEIAGSFGSMEMLQRGMKIEFAFFRYSMERREIIGIRQLPDSTVMFRH